jgi:hypothetical protein
VCSIRFSVLLPASGWQSPRRTGFSLPASTAKVGSLRSSSWSFTALGCFTEIIAYTPRVFVPVENAEVLAAVLAKWPPQSVLPKAA